MLLSHHRLYSHSFTKLQNTPNNFKNVFSRALFTLKTPKLNHCNFKYMENIPFLLSNRNFYSSSFTRSSVGTVEENNDADEEDDAAILLEGFDKELSNDKMSAMTPSAIVSELDKFIIGQAEAKKSVATAIRNRWRSKFLPPYLKGEVIPKNILLIGPTGCGKTEIARRIAKLHKAPFIKVEATKYTEVGFHGKDVDTMIIDLVDSAIHQIKSQLTENIKDKLRKRVDAQIAKKMSGLNDAENFRTLLETGALEKSTIEYMPKSKPMATLAALDSRRNQLQPIPVIQPQTKKKTTVEEYRKLKQNEEIERILKTSDVKSAAIEATEQNGIVFIDEIDKICVSNEHQGHRHTGASDEGVQRDLLPIIEGTIVHTPHGNVDTSKILFICGGAFHSCKPSDLLPELQGRLPIRVELKPLNRGDLLSILTKTENSLITQQIELLKTESVNLKFTDEAVSEIATIAAALNEGTENIGARRLHTVIEKVVEEVSFNSHLYAGQEFIIDKEYVRKVLAPLLTTTDFSKFML